MNLVLENEEDILESTEDDMLPSQTVSWGADNSKYKKRNCGQ